MRELKKWADSRPDLVLLAHMILDLEKGKGLHAPEFFRCRLHGYLNALWETRVITGKQWDLFGREVGATRSATREVDHD